MFWGNVKLVCMVVASCLALLGQFGPFPLPAHRTTIAAIVVTFFLIMGFVGVIALVVDRDYIMFTLPKADAGRLFSVSTFSPALSPPFVLRRSHAEDSTQP